VSLYWQIKDAFYSLFYIGIQGLLYANIVLVGGNANIPGYMDRM
jgi:actin-related protein